MSSTTAILILDRQHEEGSYLLQAERREGSDASERAVCAFRRL